MAPAYGREGEEGRRSVRRRPVRFVGLTGFAAFDRRPLLVALAGPNGAGKSTFYHAHLKPSGLRLVNADVLAGALRLEAAAAMKLADALRRALVERRESFVLETVFSDPVGDKVGFLAEAATAGYTVVLCFIGLDNPRTSAERVAMRVSQGGHDVPLAKLVSRYPRTLANLKAAIRALPHVIVYDNSDLAHPYRWIAVFAGGIAVERTRTVPAWFRGVEP